MYGADKQSSSGPGENSDDEDDDLPDDDQINEMMASYTGELELYKQMDEEKALKAGNLKLLGLLLL